MRASAVRAPAVLAVPIVSESERAFAVLVAEHLPRLRARAKQLCRTHVDPEDLLQDALMRAFCARDQLRDVRRMRSWLLSIISNTFIDALRKQRARPTHVPLDSDPESEICDNRSDALPWQRIGDVELHAAIEHLPDDVRDTYRLFASGGKDYSEIAAIVGVPKSTVGTRLLRARQRLRELLSTVVENTP